MTKNVVSRGVEKKTFDLYLSFQSMPALFGIGRRPTLTFVPICWGEKVGLVRHVSAESENEWVFPQEGIRLGDGTLINATIRGLGELGLEESDVVAYRMKPLAYFENVIPKERKRYGGMTKGHYMVGVPVHSPRRIHLNRGELNGITWVSSAAEFNDMTHVVAAKRPVKYAGMVKAIQSAHQRGMSSWTVH